MTAKGTFTPIKDRKNRDLTSAAVNVKVSPGVKSTKAEDGKTRPKR